eukprot:4562188-Pleurochrysis_carterae.AAC.1
MSDGTPGWTPFASEELPFTWYECGRGFSSACGRNLHRCRTAVRGTDSAVTKRPRSCRESPSSTSYQCPRIAKQNC